MNNQETVKEARLKAGLTTKQAAALVGVKEITWKRWEGQTSKLTEIPFAHWELFLLKTGEHPTHFIAEKVNSN